MKPQAAAFLEKSRELLDHADKMLSIDLGEDAGRAAYLAGFHAAQAFIFEKQSRVLKTHSGVRSEFLRMTKDDPRCDMELRAFLGQSYQLKTIADYETGPGAHVSAESAGAAIRIARRFVECVTTLIPPNIARSAPETAL